MIVGLDVPDTVGQSTAFGTGDFLLLKAPVRQFDLVGKQHTAGHDMNQLELGLNGPQPRLGLGSIRHGFDNLNPKEVVGIAFEALVAISGHFVLPFCLGNGWTHVMRMEASMGREMVEFDSVPVLDVRGSVAPCLRASDRNIFRCDRLSRVLQEPDIVVVFVWVQGNLLLVAAARIH